MFLKMRKSDKNETKQSDDVPDVEQSNENTDQGEDTLVNQITNLDELSKADNGIEEDEDSVLQKATPAQELELDTEPAPEP